jgi:TRAP-type C4-dicarboxylate transport system substrate-binding protein
MNEPGVVIMSKQFYNKLPEDLKLVVDLAGRNSILWERQEMDEENKRALKKLEEAGMKVNTLSNAAIAEFRRVAHEQVYPEVIKTKACGPKTKELIDLFAWANK